MTRRGGPEHRLQRAAGALKGSVTFLQTIADEEGIEVPLEVVQAANLIRSWTRSLGARDPDPPAWGAYTPPDQHAGRPQTRHPLRRTRR